MGYLTRYTGWLSFTMSSNAEAFHASARLRKAIAAIGQNELLDVFVEFDKVYLKVDSCLTDWYDAVDDLVKFYNLLDASYVCGVIQCAGEDPGDHWIIRGNGKCLEQVHCVIVPNEETAVRIT